MQIFLRASYFMFKNGIINYICCIYLLSHIFIKKKKRYLKLHLYNGIYNFQNVIKYEIACVIEKVTFRKSKRLHYVLSQIAMIRAIDKPARERFRVK